MASIEAVGAREILDSRGNPTVEVEVALDDGTISRAAVPSGASTGAFEAVELRDGGDRYGGKGVTKAVDAVLDVIAPALVGFEASEQRLVDQALLDLDGTDNKAKLGANAILGVSLAVARAAADSADLPLFRYVGGPERPPAAGADDEHPQRRRARRHRRRRPGVHGRPDRRRPRSARRCEQGAEVYHALKSVLKEKGFATGLGDEGGFAPDLANNRAALDLIAEAVGKTGLTLGDDIVLALDVAATEFYDERRLHRSRARAAAPAEMQAYYAELVRRLPDRLDRGPPRRGGLGGLGVDDRRPRRPDPDRRRRPLRHQRRAPRAAASPSGRPTRCW